MNRVGRNVGMLLVIATMAVTTFAGEIQVAWDATPGATGYKVYYGTSSGGYGTPVVVYGTSATIQGLQDCVSYFVAVKAFNSAGDSPNYSNELSGWSRPSITSATPPAAMQGDQIVIDVMGANFRSGARVQVSPDPGLCSTLVTVAPGTQRYLQCVTNADCVVHNTPPAQDLDSGPCRNLNTVVLTSVSVLSCNHLQLLATLQPGPGGGRPAQVGMVDLTVVNQDQVFGTKPQAFEILVNPKRFDINRSDSITTNRIDGKDVIYLSRYHNSSETFDNADYRPDYDFDGNGSIDGDDLTYMARSFGLCWSAASQSWTLAACPTAMQ
jgi:hypothetical protein